MKTNYEKDLARLNKKGTEACSICHTPFSGNAMVFTVVGYDRLGKLQVTTGCCAERIVDIRSLGLCGFFEQERADEYLRQHPLYETLAQHRATGDLPTQ